MLVRSTCLLAFLAHQAAAGGLDVFTQKGESGKKDRPNDPNPLIIEGTEAGVGQYPYYAHMQIAVGTSLYSCGGSLIAPRVILSAAHCNDPYNDSNVEKGYVGATSYWSTDNGAVLGECEEWKNHPEFIPGEFDFFGGILPGTTVLGGNDFALCLLKEPVYIDMSSVTLKMNEDPSFPPDTTDTVTESMGMGRTSGDRSEGTDVLLRADLNILPQETCNNLYSEIDETMICTLDNMDNTMSGVCSGDSGGPIVVSSVEDGKTIHTQVGVVSWGSGDCGTNPDVHARVSEGMEWIKSAVCDDWGVSADFCDPPMCPNGESVFTVTITTDDTPDQNMWSLKDSAGDVVESQSFEVANAKYVTTVCLAPDQYVFELTDSGDDGMPDGSVEVSLNNEVVYEDFSSGSKIEFIIIAPDDLTNNPTAAPTPAQSEAPTMAPTDYECDTNQNLKITVQNDFYYYETYWTLEQYVNEDEMWTEITRNNLDAFDLFVNTICLDTAGVYRFSIFDSYGDGILYGGFYDVELNGNTIASGVDFGFDDITVFDTCVDSDSESFRLNAGQTGTCQDFASYTENRNNAGRTGCRQRNLNAPGRQKVFDLCPHTCARFGFGECAYP